MTEIRIAPLGDHPRLVATIARWHFDEWAGGHPGSDVEDWIAGLEDRVCPDRIPTTFVALAGEEPVGSTSLVFHDMATRRDLTPWLAGVFVVPAWRRRGVASALCEHAANAARSFGVETLYLYTHTAEALYRRLGWEVLGREPYEGREQTIMVRDLRQRSRETT